MTITKRALLAAAGTAAGSTLLSHAAGAQSFPFAPNQRCPDPAVQILDPGLAKIPDRRQPSSHSPCRCLLFGGRIDGWQALGTSSLLARLER
jgi:hypothetical protein